MPQIINIHARQILDSRGIPTIEVDVISDSAVVGSASIPSGATTGDFEAYELRDEDSERFLGKGVLKAINNVNTILNDELKGFFVEDQRVLDAAMIALDGTDNKSNLGANAILAVSIAAARCAAQSLGIPLYKYLGGVNATVLPIPMIGVINGGQLSDNRLDIQEFMIMPCGAETFSEALRMGTEISLNLKHLFKSKKLSTNVSEEGGFAPNLESHEQALDFILQAIELSKYKPGEDVYIALDASSSNFYNRELQNYTFKSTGQTYSSAELIDYWKTLVKRYPIISIEDGLDQEDWEGWTKLTKSLGHKIQIVGDDLFVTNIDRLRKGIELKAANSIIIKPNQIGTVTEMLNTVRFADINSLTSIISHRSGETEDVLIAELAVALNTGLIKTGAISRTERIAKYNELLRIEEALGASASYLGKDFKFI
jgi:enolase